MTSNGNTRNIDVGRRRPRMFSHLSLVGAGLLALACNGGDGAGASAGAEDPDTVGDAGLQVILDVTPITEYRSVVVEPRTLHVKGPDFEEDITLDVGQIDLKSLERVPELDLGTLTVPATRVTKIEVTFADTGYVITASGERREIHVPSGRVRLGSSFELREQTTTRIVAAIVTDASLHPADDKQVLHPVVQAKSVEYVAYGEADPRQDTYTATIGPEGGSVYLLDGRGLEIPPGALPHDTEIGVSDINDMSLAGTLELPSYLGDGVVLDGLSLEPHGLVLEEAADLVLAPPAHPGEGNVLAPVSRASSAEPWRAYGSDEWGTDVAVVLADGRVLQAVDSFSDHGVVQFQVNVGPFSTSLTLEHYADLAGTDLRFWRSPGMGGPGLVDGIWSPFPDAGILDPEFRRARWKEVLEAIVSREGFDQDTRYEDTTSAVTSLVRGGTTVVDHVLIGDDLFDILPSHMVVETLSETLLLEMWAEHIVFDNNRTLLLTAYEAQRITVYERVVHDLADFWGEVGDYADIATIAADSVDVINAALISHTLTRDWIESMDAIFEQSPLVEDPMFREAWAEVKLEAEQAQHSAIQSILWTLQTQSVEQAVQTLAVDASLMVAGNWVVRALRSRYARWGTKMGGVLSLLAESVVINLQDTIGVHREAARNSLTATVFAEAFLDTIDGPLERYRQEGAVYVLWAYGSARGDWYYHPDASALSRGALFIVRALTGELQDWQEGRALFDEERADLAPKVADFLFDNAVRPTSVIAEDDAIVDETSAGFVRMGPEPYWHEEVSPGAGYLNSCLWTLNNQFGVVGVENVGIWSSPEWTGSDAVQVRVQIPSATFAGARACYVIDTIGGPYFRQVHQGAHAGELIDLGLFPSAPGNVVRVTLQDTTPDAHLTERIGFDAIQFESAPATPLAAVSADCRTATAWAEPPSGRTRFPLGNGTVPTPGRYDDDWYDAQQFGDTGFKGKPHLGNDWNRDGANDLDEVVSSPGVTQEVVFAGDAGPGWDGVVVLRLVSWSDPFVVPGDHSSSPTTDILVMLAHLDPGSIGWSRGDVIEGQGVPIGTIGPPPCNDPGCGSHLHLEVMSVLSSNVPGKGYAWDLDGRVDPTAFFVANQ